MKEIEEDGVVYVERSVPLMWGCYLAGGILLLVAVAVFVLTLVAMGVL